MEKSIRLPVKGFCMAKPVSLGAQISFWSGPQRLPTTCFFKSAERGSNRGTSSSYHPVLNEMHPFIFTMSKVNLVGLPKDAT